MASTYTEARGLDVKKLRGDTRQIEPVRLRRGENGLTNIEGHITADGEPYNLTGMTVKFRAVNRARQFINDAARITNAASGIVTYTVTNTLTSVEGEAFVAYFEFSDGSNIITSDTIPILVLENTDISTEQADEYKNQIDRLLDELEGKIGDVSGAVKNANDAATKANTATTNATNATTKANNAATSANNAATEARNAATEASESVAGANAAKDAANNAANNANTAAQDANSAASRANNAATRVEDAVTSATEAAENANQAASNMEAHINAAKIATDSANEAADAAITATAEANNAASDAANAAVSANTAADTVNNAMKTYKTIVSEVSTWAINDSGTDVPTFWNESQPKPEKGRWLWERRETSYNQGSPTIVYVPTYSGLDGEFEGEYRVQYLEGKVNAMNDLTTGINLLRGTRHPKAGKTSHNGGLFKSDGYLLNIAVIEDTGLGYSIIRLDRSGNTGSVNFSAETITDLQPGSYTFSCDYMLKTPWVSTLDIFIQIRIFSKDNTQKSIAKVTGNDAVSKHGSEVGIWHRASVSISADSVDDGDYAVCTMGTGATNIVLTRFPVFERGRINNPIWSPSPFDIDYINDETTGINLAIGTRDCILGTEKFTSLSNTYTVNGFSVSPINYPASALHVEKDSDGYSNWVFNNTTNSTLQVNSSMVKGPKTGESYTIDFEIYSDDFSTFDTNFVYCYTFYIGETNMPTIQTIGSDILSNVGKFRNGEWNKYTFVASLTSEIENPDISAFFMRFTVPSGKNMPFRVRKLGIYRGRINNPVWSASPFDVAQVSEQNAYPNGTYAGVSIADKFASEIGSTHIATWLQSRVKAANFSGLNIMDYVDIALDGVTVRYRIAAIDPYYNCGQSAAIGHHIVFVPDSTWSLTSNLDGSYLVNGSNILWNTSKTNNGTSDSPHPYLVSNLHKWEIEVHLKRFPKEWQDAMLSRMCFVESRYSSSSLLSSSTAFAYTDIGKIWSLSEFEVSGSSSIGVTRFSIGFDCQLPMFELSKNKIKGRAAYWTRTTSNGSDKEICAMSSTGALSSFEATQNTVRPLPCFMIG